MDNHNKTVHNPETGEEKTLNDNFIQFYIDNLSLIGEIASKNPTAIKVLMFLTKYMDKKNALIVSQTTMSDVLDVHRNTISNAVNYLVEQKIIRVFKSGSTNIYTVNSEIAWRDDADNKKYAHFTAKVYISPNEQENEYKKEFFPHLLKNLKKPKNIRITQKEAIRNFEVQK